MPFIRVAGLALLFTLLWAVGCGEPAAPAQNTVSRRGVDAPNLQNYNQNRHGVRAPAPNTSQ